MIKARDLLEHFVSRSTWVKRENTVDRVIIGDGEKAFDKCLVTWMPSFAAVRTAVERGYGLLVAHEPTFYDHCNDTPGSYGERFDVVARKVDYINRHGLTIVRLHDSWDLWPEIGVPWAWADFLGLGTKPAAVNECRSQLRFDVAPRTLEELARDVAARCAAINEPMVQVTGDLSQTVSKVGVGTGCGCDLATFWGLGCDCSIVCDDATRYWDQIQIAQDYARPVIRVSHGTSEEPGMMTLTKYINDTFPGLRAQRLPHGATFRLVGAK
ncbi:MAG: Nif3-like dinuclear metal center hexameric protein [Planctomycetota bacterium]|nr:Nif3-like dinuclear metal center hexameric protein [Planctomycetota bacterium]